MLHQLPERLQFEAGNPDQNGNTGCGVFRREGTKFERFLQLKQHAKRKLLYYENWINGVSEVFKNQSFKNQLFSSFHSPFKGKNDLYIRQHDLKPLFEIFSSEN